MRTRLMAVVCAFSAHAWAQPADDARRADDDARKAAEGAAAAAKESEQKTLRYMIEAQRAQAQAEAAAAAEGPRVEAAADEPQSIFDKLQFLGNANLIGGSLATEGGETLASGGVGVYAETKRWSFVTSFTFGSQGTSQDNATAADYVNFLRSPTSAIGGQVQVRFLEPVGKVCSVGGGITARVNAIDFAFGEGQKESIKILAIDPSIAVSLLFSDKQQISFVGEIGLGLRFWNKPVQSFATALGLADSSHAYAGIRVLGALAISNLYVGVEVTRYGGGKLEALKEFSVIPYVGLRGGLEVFEKQSISTRKGANGARTIAPSTPLP